MTIDMDLAQFSLQSFLILALIGITAFYAVQTKRQADLLAKQINALSQQRHKSIQPSLQIDKISITIRQPTETAELRLELLLSNVGSGPALGLDISAAVIIDIVNQTTSTTTRRAVYFKLIRTFREVYLERTAEPATFELDPIPGEFSDLKARDGFIDIKLEFRDIDHSSISDIKPIPLDEGIYRWEVTDERWFVP